VPSIDRDSSQDPVAFTAPVPRSTHRFWRRVNRWVTISRHPEPCADPLPPHSGESDSRRSFRSTRLPTVSPADLRAELGPRSLDPDRSFWSAFAELIRDRTSPTDFCNNHDVRATKPELLILAGTETAISFLFFSHHASPLARSGDEWRAALRPFVPTPVLVPPACTGLPNRDAGPSPHHRDFHHDA